MNFLTQLGVFILGPLWHTLFIVWGIILNIWLSFLIPKFDSQHRTSDKNYAIGMIFFAVLSTVGSAHLALKSWGVLLGWWKPDELPRGRLVLIAAGILALPISAVVFVFAARTWIWYFGFRSTGDTMDAAYSAVYGALSLVSIFRFYLESAIICGQAICSRTSRYSTAV